MFSYCNNNPVIYWDAEGTFPAEIPMIENGLNLPHSGGMPITIDGTTYYYAIDIQHGELYEYWFDGNGNLVWARHHSNHNKPWAHDDPHDHKGGKDKDGNNTLVTGPLPKNDHFKGPKEIENLISFEDKATSVVTVAAATVVIYQVAKWVLASLLAPPSGGTSYAFALLLP